jgi:hypothetical protein
MELSKKAGRCCHTIYDTLGGGGTTCTRAQSRIEAELLAAILAALREHAIRFFSGQAEPDAGRHRTSG